MQPLPLPFSKQPSLNDFLYIAVTCNSREKQTNNESIYILPVNKVEKLETISNVL